MIQRQEKGEYICVYLIILKHLKNSLRLLLNVPVTQAWSTLLYRWSIFNGAVGKSLWWCVTCHSTSLAAHEHLSSYWWKQQTRIPDILVCQEVFLVLSTSESCDYYLTHFTLLTYIRELNLWLVSGETAIKPRQSLYLSLFTHTIAVGNTATIYIWKVKNSVA